MGTLRTKIDQDSDGCARVTLSGAMDEATDLDEAFATLDCDTVFDLSGVERINSIGVHRWVRAMERIN
jgi:anti-anti-sigma regulatory factor